ncbi:hypothetical protein [Archangium sp.]|uniref:hypothetical protein n=1 Tax=Archangium sp. TaxID=1872627 RepID=UPI002D5CB3DB|nr:hypothetical protein [Archangium sp.]HYO54574.1 hypothetical protein [Archangium sp.]
MKSMITLREHLVYELECDLFAARVRGPQSQLVVNYGYEGVVALDCIQRRQLPVISFPTDDFSIYSWAMSPKGDVSYAFSGDPGEGALLIDHEKETSVPLDLPAGMPLVSDLNWFSPSTCVWGYDGGLWTINGPVVRRATESDATVYMSYFYRRVLSHYAVVKTDPYQRGLYVRSKEFERKTIGFMPFDSNKQPLLLEQDGSAVDTTSFGDTLFVSFESEILVLEGGTTRTLMRAQEGELFVRINVVEHAGDACLTVISSAEDHLNPARGRVTIYQILRGT